MVDKRKNNDLVIDFETMGQDSCNCAAIDCSALFFEWDRFISKNPYSFEELLGKVYKYKLDVKQQVTEYGYVIEEDTLNFWQTVDASTRAKIAPKKTDISIIDFCNQFIGMLADNKKVDYWWSRANNFDPVILERLMRRTKNHHNLSQYLKFYRIRDVRSFIDAKFDFETVNGFIPISDEEYWKSTFKEHSSDHDVVADVLRLQAITRAEQDMEQAKR